MNFGFYISGPSGRLRKFIKQADIKVIEKIKIIISDCEIGDEYKSFLNEYEIKYNIYEYGSFDGADNTEKNLFLSDLIMKDLDKHNVDYCFSFGGHLLSGNLLEKYNNRLINFHPSILSMIPGLRAIDKAAEQGLFLVGNTAHFIDSGMDTGTIIMQSVIPMQAFLAEKDYDTVLDMQIDMLNKLIIILEEERLQITDGRAVITGADYFKSFTFPDI